VPPLDEAGEGAQLPETCTFVFGVVLGGLGESPNSETAAEFRNGLELGVTSHSGGSGKLIMNLLGFGKATFWLTRVEFSSFSLDSSSSSENRFGLLSK